MFKSLGLSQKNLGRIVASLVSFIVLALLYFSAIIYFEQCILSKQKNNPVAKAQASFPQDDVVAVEEKQALPPLTSKINKKVITFYSFFCDLTKTNTSFGSLDKKSDAKQEIDKQTLYLGSFPYTTAVVDTEKTSLYFEGVSNSIIFPPDYAWDTASQEMVDQHKTIFDGYINNKLDGPYNDKRCLNNNCLEYKNNRLFYNGKEISFPKGIETRYLKAVSLGNVGQKWLVGFTVQDNGYRGEVFYFDGAAFSKIQNFPSISSNYFGLFGFGGSEDDFLVIYGAYKGQAFRVRGEKITNLDKFFGYRPMNNGFKPEIIRAKSANYSYWYVYSSTLDALRFIKLWEDTDGEISGETSLAYDLGIIGKSAEFKLIEAKSDEVVLLAKINSGNNITWQVFRDKGFINNEEKVLVTLPITHNAENPEIFIKKIYESSLVLDANGQGLVRVEFSADGKKWQEISWGRDIEFEQEATRQYFIRTIFSPLDNKFYSPSISNILFSYVCRI